MIFPSEHGVEWFVEKEKVLSRILAILIVLVLISKTGAVLRYVLFNDVGTHYLQNEFYNQDNIDVLFLGSSHVRQAINTKIIDERTALNSYNLGTSSQNYDGSYAFLREADKLYDLKKVYLDVYYIMGQQVDKAERTELSSTYIVGDYLKDSSVNRLRFLFQASDKDYWINGFFPERRYWKNLFNEEERDNIIGLKESEAYSLFLEEKTKGFTGKDDSNLEGTIISSSVYENIPDPFITDECKEDISKIINYCKKKNIEIVLMSIPIPDFRLSEVGNYDYYVSEMKAFCEANGVEYYDYNLAKREYFPSNDELFYDDHHLNTEGADLFCNLLMDVEEGKINPSDLFYDSYENKIQNDDFRILGAYMISEDDGLNFRLVDNKRGNAEYKFYLGEEKVLVSDAWGTNEIFIEDKKCEEVTVEYRITGSNVKSGQITYILE